MKTSIDARQLATMAASLENDELGAAVRLLERIISTGKPVHASRLCIISRLSETEWQTCSDAILEFFIVDESGAVSHAALADASIPSASEAPKSPAGRTPGLAIVSPTRTPQVPSYARQSAPERISIKKAAYDTMLRLCASSGQSESVARSIMASLLKTWPEGDVYEAVYKADRQEFIVDPRTWIIACLQNSSRPLSRAPRRAQAAEPVPVPRKNREMVNPKNVGVSTSTADMIRESNRSLRLDFAGNGGDE